MPPFATTSWHNNKPRWWDRIIAISLTPLHPVKKTQTGGRMMRSIGASLWPPHLSQRAQCGMQPQTTIMINSWNGESDSCVVNCLPREAGGCIVMMMVWRNMRRYSDDDEVTDGGAIIRQKRSLLLGVLFLSPSARCHQKTICRWRTLGPMPEALAIFWMEIAGVIIRFWKMRKEITSEKGVIIRQKRSRCPIKN